MTTSPAKNERIVVLGLGYVGLPIAVALARHYDHVIGFDISPNRVRTLSEGHDWTDEITDAELAASALRFSDNPDCMADASVIIVTVPTPIDDMRRPDLSPMDSACQMIGKRVRPGTIIIFESTVYPGVTEDFCAPILERESGLKAGSDFFLAYSPERINPGDKVRRLETITKIISADCPESLARVRDLYNSIIEAGLHEAPSIRVAEAAKVIENAQRDINIAFVNEITQIFARDNISVWDVLDAAGTKWNFLPFTPGLVGGHCIGVDPYYLAYRGQMLGHDPQVILAGRVINDDMGRWVADQVHGCLETRASNILILGLTFKENVPDLRNSKVSDVVKRLRWLGHTVTVHDPHAEVEQAEEEYGITLDADALNRQYDAVVGAVSHKEYGELDSAALQSLVAPGGLLFDLKRIWPTYAGDASALGDGRRYAGI